MAGPRVCIAGPMAESCLWLTEAVVRAKEYLLVKIRREILNSSVQ